MSMLRYEVFSKGNTQLRVLYLLSVVKQEFAAQILFPTSGHISSLLFAQQHIMNDGVEIRAMRAMRAVTASSDAKPTWTRPIGYEYRNLKIAQLLLMLLIFRRNLLYFSKSPSSPQTLLEAGLTATLIVYTYAIVPSKPPSLGQAHHASPYGVHRPP